mgnify:CR=1 FL=1
MNKNVKKFLFISILSFPLVLTSCSFAGGNKLDASLNMSSCTLEVGDTQQLELKSVTYGGSNVTSNKYTCSWTTSNSYVAAVSNNGLVLAMGAGTADVSAVVDFAVTGKQVTTSCRVTVTDSGEVTVTLSRSSVNIQKGKTLKLTATVKHATDSSVTWSSDSDVVTVDNTGLISASTDAAIGTKATITAVSNEDPNAKDTCTVTVVEDVAYQYDYTFMFYMCASTLEYDSSERRPEVGLFTEDIKELLSVDYPSNVKVIIETGGTKKWSLPSTCIDGPSYISANSLQRWEISNKKLKLIDTLTTNHMADGTSYQSFLEWGLRDYNAEQMGVVISGHGAGIGGCAFDDNYITTIEGYKTEKGLNTSEIVSATRNALSKYNRNKFTWMGFDCCLMGCADVASVLADYFDYMVASQEVEAGEGWDHDSYMDLVVKNPNVQPEVLLPKIASTFVASVHNDYCLSYEPCLQTLSVLDLTKMDTFTNEFNSYISKCGTSSYNKYKTAFINAYNAFGTDKDVAYGAVDMKDYLTELKTQFSSVSNTNVLSALDELVLANSYCSRYGTVKPCGVSAFLPECTSSRQSLQCYESDYTGNDVTKFTAYQNMCLANGSF